MPDYLLIELNQAAVEGLANIDSVILKHYNIPSIYQIAPIYKTGGPESWRDIGSILTEYDRQGRRWGDCKDFTAWRLAELRKAGIAAHAESIVTREGKKLLFHTYVRYADGSLEDPARELGMP